MANLIDRVLLGGAFVCSGLVHRKVGRVEHRVEHVEQAQEDAAGRALLREQAAGMPLPTGYGIQVCGPGGEDIVIPICLPPGFELASLVIAPSFLADGEPETPAHAAPAVPEPEAAPPAAPHVGERLDNGMRLVYGESQPYSARLDQAPLPPAPERPRDTSPLRESVL